MPYQRKSHVNPEASMHTYDVLNYAAALVFFLCCAYQLLYLLIPLIRKEKPLPPSRKEHDFAVLICARNEERVIGDLLDCLRRQTYPSDKLHVFVMADNCTDGTEAAARAAGAGVYVRHDSRHVGKGYALDALLTCLGKDHPEGFDGYFVFDADNVLEDDFVEQMDRSFSSGLEIVTSYRNSVNFDGSWISAGYALWFLRESRFLNHARHLLGISCGVSGTGFLFSRAVAEELGGWPFYTLTEDIEFTAYQLVQGRRIGFCSGAVLYDEQPVDFPQSWRQRLRWARGYLQVIRRYGLRLAGGVLRGSFACYDMLMNLLPAMVVTFFTLMSALVLTVWGAFSGIGLLPGLGGFARSLGSTLLMLFCLGAFTGVCEWRKIRAGTLKKLAYLFTFPLFMISYLPVGVAAVFHNPGWKPIRHGVGRSSGRRKCRKSIFSEPGAE